MKRFATTLSPTSIMLSSLSVLLLALSACDELSQPEEPEIAAIAVSFNKSGGGGGSESLRIIISPESADVEVGESLTFVALDASGNHLKANWSSGNTAVATINPWGVLTGVAPGSTSITAKSKRNSASASVRVTAPAASPPPPSTAPTIASVTVSPASASVNVGATVQLAAVAKDASGNTISTTFSWSSSNASVASVSASGLVTGIAGGSATISASAGGKSGSSAVTVNAPSSSPTNPNWSAVIAGVRPRGFGAGAYSLIPAASNGATYYVATNGNDSNPGSSTQPFRTINKAAQVAIAGDVVIIRNGTYQESVFVRNSGTASRRIVFQAENRGGVVLTGGSYVFRSTNMVARIGDTPQKFITVKGLIFRQYAGNGSGSVALRAAEGWHVVDCMFDDAAETAVSIFDHDIRLERTTFQNNYIHAFAVYGGYAGGTSPSDPQYRPVQNLHVIDVVLRGNNAANSTKVGAVASTVVKISISRGLVIDNMESTANHGSGIWLDEKNTNYTIRNSYVHRNKGVFDANGVYRRENGRGIYLEKNWGSGLVENNVVMDNEGAGLVLVNSEDLMIRSNLLVRNEQSVQLLNLTGTGYDWNRLYNVTMRGNHMKGWRVNGSIWARGGVFTSASEMKLSVDESVYELGTDAILVQWPPPTYGALTLEQARSKYGWEHAGRLGTSSW